MMRCFLGENFKAANHSGCSMGVIYWLLLVSFTVRNSSKKRSIKSWESHSLVRDGLRKSMVRTGTCSGENAWLKSLAQVTGGCVLVGQTMGKSLSDCPSHHSPIRDLEVKVYFKVLLGKDLFRKESHALCFLSINSRFWLSGKVL